MSEINDAFEGLSQSLRILLETVYRSHELLFVDAHEAAGNIELALTAALNSVHSLYDASSKSVELDWYGNPETAAILAVRNARHHNLARRVRGIYTYHLQQPNPERLRRYVYVDYPTTSDGGDTFDVPVSWFDVNKLLTMPQSESRLRPSAVRSIAEYLSLDVMNGYAGSFGVRPESVFFNITPLIVNAARIVVPAVKDFLNPRSTEAKVYLDLFQTVEAAETKSPIPKELPIFLPS